MFVLNTAHLFKVVANKIMLLVVSKLENDILVKSFLFLLRRISCAKLEFEIKNPREKTRDKFSFNSQIGSFQSRLYRWKIRKKAYIRYTLTLAFEATFHVVGGQSICRLYEKINKKNTWGSNSTPPPQITQIYICIRF